MITGIFAGVTWAIETVVLGIALTKMSIFTNSAVLFLAPLVATFLHDAFSAIFAFIYNVIKRNLKDLFSILKNKNVKWIIVASLIGGPIGMSGYVMAVSFMGASIGAVASAIYPAIGTALACLFLKERVKWYQWAFLILSLLGVYGLSYSPAINIENFWLGLIGAFMCAFGWGIEAVVLAKCLKDDKIKNEYALNIRQTVSAVAYGIILLPIIGGWNFTADLIKSDANVTFLFIGIAGLFATVSYLFYYKTINKIGASKAMALNITYTAWAMVFTLMLGDLSVLNPLTVICAFVIVVCGILSATDVKKLLVKQNAICEISSIEQRDQTIDK